MVSSLAISVGISKSIHSLTEKGLTDKEVQKILKEGLYHITSIENSKKIIDSGYIKKSGLISSYSAIIGKTIKHFNKFVQNEESGVDFGLSKISSLSKEIDGLKRTFLFCGMPDMAKLIFNINEKTLKACGNKLTAIYIPPEDAKNFIIKDKLTTRRIDGAIMCKGNFESANMQVKEMAIALDSKGIPYVKEDYTEQDKKDEKRVSKKISNMNIVDKIFPTFML
ncbi:MAG: hypothetical protein A2Y24_03100 [Clostridiales bacterium GWE2_32_10]|nr:MAG: hypothetical protein A2Y24_03100 [Clostridiales bacterium GWE2_32_10]